MGRDDHAAGHGLRANRHLWTVIEAAHDLAFRTLLGLIGRQVQTRLNERMIEDRVLFAAGHEGETSQIRKHAPGPILAKDMQQCTRLWELVRREIPTDGR